MWLLVMSFCLAVSQISIKSAIVIRSELTTDILLSYFSDSLAILDASRLDFSSLQSEIDRANGLFLIDLTLSKRFIPTLNEISKDLQIAYLTLYPDTTEFENRFALHYREDDQALSLEHLINYLEISSYALLSSSNSKDLLIANIISQDFPQIVSKIFYSVDIAPNVASSIIGKMVKAKGIRKLIVVDRTESLLEIENMIEIKKLDVEGTIIMYSGFGIWNARLDGAIIVVENGLEAANSEENYHYLAVEKVLNYINTEVEGISVLHFSREQVLEILKKYQKIPPRYAVINIHQASKAIVGSIISVRSTRDYIVNITNSIYYPGNVTVVPTNTKTKLTLSIANGIHDPYYSLTYPILQYLYLGANYAVDRSNLLEEIPNFYLELFPTDCGMLWYDAYWYYSCFAPIASQMGIAFLTSFFPAAIEGNLLTLRSLGLNLPQISPLNTDDSLLDKKLYPELLVLGAPATLYEFTSFYILKTLGYTDIILIGSNDTQAGIDSYNMMKTALFENGLNLVDIGEKAFLPVNYDREDFQNYSRIFEAIKETKCTCIIITRVDRGMVLEGLYDVGIRSGSFITIADTGLALVLDGIEEPYYTKRKELVKGMLVLLYKEYSGSLGIQLEQELKSIYQEVSYMCMTYDTVSTVKAAILYLLSIGEDYEDPDQLMKAMRTGKFIGCLGNVFFSPSDNSRSSLQFLVQQIEINDTLKSIYTTNIAVFDRFSTQIITMINPYEWPTGTIPPNYRPYSPCPFDEFQIMDSDKGKALLYAISVIVFGISLCAFVFGMKTLDYPFNELTEEKDISLDDMMFFAYFPVQFFQFITMGPDQEAYKYIVQNFQVLVSMDFTLYFNVTFQSFWRLYYFVLSLAVFCGVSSIFYLRQLDTKMAGSKTIQKIDALFSKVLSIAGHMGFLPMFSMLMNLFLCEKGISEDLSNSYLYQDCTTFCYTGRHKNLVIGTVIIIAIALPSLILNRPYLEELQHSLSIRTKSSYLLLLSVVQICLVILNKTLKGYDQNALGVAAICVLVGLVIITVVMKPYNYKRAYVSQIISIVLAIWTIGISVVFRNFSMIQVWLIIEFLGLLVLCIVGIIFLKKTKQLLISKKGTDISTLFLFQFCKNYEHLIKDPNSLHLSKNEKKSEPQGPLVHHK